MENSLDLGIVWKKRHVIWWNLNFIAEWIFKLKQNLKKHVKFSLIGIFWIKLISKILLRQNSHSTPVKCIKTKFKRFVTPSKFLNSIQLVAFILRSRYFCGKGNSRQIDAGRKRRHRSIRAVKGWVSKKKKLYHDEWRTCFSWLLFLSRNFHAFRSVIWCFWSWILWNYDAERTSNTCAILSVQVDKFPRAMKTEIKRKTLIFKIKMWLLNFLSNSTSFWRFQMLVCFVWRFKFKFQLWRRQFGSSFSLVANWSRERDCLWQGN